MTEFYPSYLFNFLKVLKLACITLVLNVSISTASAQNLVPNPSFEETTYCPTTPGDVGALTNWFNCGGSPDYYNSCADNSTLVDVPENWVGNQSPRSGNGYVGIATYAVAASPNREYIGTQLTQTLIVGTKYYLSAFISRADSFPCVCSSNNFGFKFSTVPYSYTTPVSTENDANFSSGNIVADSIGWVRIAGSFIADSLYQYAMLGNFFDNSNTNTSGVCGTSSVAYYYLDEICISTDSLACTTLGFQGQKPHLDFSIYPNPTFGTFNIDLPNLNTSYKMTIYDCFGQIVYHKGEVSSSHSTFEIATDSPDILFVEILYEHQYYHYKILKQ